MTYRGKRALDLVLAIPLIAVAAPFMLVGAVAVWLSSPGPVLFRQTRIGRNGVPFEILKLRSMYADNDDGIHREMIRRELEYGAELDPNDAGNYAPDDDPRVTPVGRLLRRSSIDELPQLFNVLSGDMSLVGPRPLIDWERDMLSSDDLVREQVKPGVTGLFQVEGRKSMTTPEMLVLDHHYVETASLKVDVEILVRTPAALLNGTGAV